MHYNSVEMAGQNTEGQNRGAGTSENLVLAAGIEDRQDHKVRMREQPFLGFGTRGFRGAGQRTEMLISRQASQMIETDPREGGNFVLGEKFLARLNSHHLPPHDVRCCQKIKRCIQALQ